MSIKSRSACEGVISADVICVSAGLQCNRCQRLNYHTLRQSLKYLGKNGLH